MKVFFRKILLFAVINLLIFNVLMKVGDKILGINSPNAKPKHVSYLILGSSRGQVFGLSKINTTCRLLGQSCEVLAASGAGVLPQFTVLRLFLREGGSTENIIYLVDPFCFYSDKFNELQAIGARVGFDWRNMPIFFSWDYGLHFFLVGYVKPKLIAFREQQLWQKQSDAVEAVDFSATAQAFRISQLYPQGIRQKNLDKYMNVFDRLLKIAQVQNIKVYVILTPNLIKEEPGKREILDRLSALQSIYAFQLYDLSHVMTEITYFENVDHFNSKGVKFFLTEYLRPILDGQNKIRQHRVTAPSRNSAKLVTQAESDA